MALAVAKAVVTFVTVIFIRVTTTIITVHHHLIVVVTATIFVNHNFVGLTTVVAAVIF